MVASAEDWRSESVTNAEVKVDVCEGTGSFRVSTALPSGFEDAILSTGADRQGKSRSVCLSKPILPPSPAGVLAHAAAADAQLINGHFPSAFLPPL